MKTLATWTVEDYHRMIEAGILDDRAVELLGGEIVEMAPEEPIHRFHQELLADHLRDRLAGRALVREAGPITLADSEPEPDIAIVQPPRERYRNRHPGPEDILLLIEISNSSLTKDMELKKQIYAAAGIPEYWVIDLNRQRLLVYRSPKTADYATQQEIQQGKVSLLAFSDITVSVDNLISQ